ncbi:hypothetical protein SAMN05216267_1014150 [Actinacidiphila rubida]|uniref:Uncharacterized protein n=1 Tax=Actinacidiphila rubida TaxID=310780 RepID=A0A1H8KYM7_9ACTN|nr:hypothetical protein [Actinacidiphila rubida]SEN97993.1 hypothetical protein SAMN05216267_1014150 [Actinacidiphila rubida]
MSGPGRIRVLTGAVRGRPGSVRHSAAFLGVVGVAAELLLALTDGAVAAATGLGLITASALVLGRFAVGGAAHDSGYRRRVRLLGSRAPALGGWQGVVAKTLGEDSELHLRTVMRPQLQRLFAARLAQRHGVDMYRNPPRARALVGAELWPWIDPGAPAPRPTLPEPVLRSLLDRLEAL